MQHLTMRFEFSRPNTQLSVGRDPLHPLLYLACWGKYLSTCMLHWFHPALADGPHPSLNTHSGTWDAGEILPCSCHSVRAHMHILQTQMQQHVCRRATTVRVGREDTSETKGFLHVNTDSEREREQSRVASETYTTTLDPWDTLCDLCTHTVDVHQTETKISLV